MYTRIGTDGPVTSRIGLGVATLMREGRSSRRLSVIEEALESGVRHFDVAPLYGLGAAEKELGRALEQCGHDTTVATKYGLQPSRAAQMLSAVQGPIRRMLKASPGLRNLARSYGGSSGVEPVPSIDDLNSSVLRSLDHLRRETVDLLLLHEIAWSHEWAEVWLRASTTDGRRYRELGIASRRELLPSYPEYVVSGNHPIQTESNPFETREEYFRSIRYGLVSGHFNMLNSFLAEDAPSKASLERLTGAPLRSAADLVVFLCGLQLARSSDSIVLIGSTKPKNIQSVWNGVAAHGPSIAASITQVDALLKPLRAAITP
ncbi:aldo/keto reductase [Arthrobacter sp. OAP107]|uniref:aldo/keto reductase n=1 Tax=Arthrobacter sp. OAP107 TaxID=3156445 RepID=UPI003394AD36